MSTVLRYILITTMIGSYVESFAQIKFFPEPQKNYTQAKDNSNTREQADSILSLPFWDDFSFSINHPSDSLWLPSGVFINQGLAKDPPTIGVASFDGLRANGLPYNSNPANTGSTDSLTSKGIDLSDLSVVNNVYISFFYQYGGNGETPDSGDSLRLEGKNAENEWVSLWPSGTTGLIRDGNFNQAVIKLDNETLFHGDFQFRFLTFGRQSGSFDVWNVDYVYVNKNRSTSLEDTSYPDRAISSPPGGIFRNYRSIPINHFKYDELDDTSFTIYSLDRPGDTNQPYTYGLNVRITNYKDSVETIVLRNDENQGSGTLPPRARVEPILNNIIQPDDISAEADSALIQTETILKANDNLVPDINGSSGDYLPEVYAPIDFRNNDTTRVSYQLKDYYAYDDGTAEAGVGLNSSGDIFAARFDMLTDTTDSLVAIDLYFPYINTQPTGKSIQLIVWNNNDTIPGILKHRETFTIKTNNGLNTFQRYELRNSIAVMGTFYIGYQQSANGELGIGLDKNTSSGDKIYYNLDGTWHQNTIVQGSLMMRPVFGELNKTVVGIDRPENLPIKAYPNPSSGIYTISGEFNELILTDLRGVKKSVHLIKYDSQKSSINIESLADGIYILRFVKGKTVQTLKIIKEAD